MKNIMPTIPTATELAIKYAKREQLPLCQYLLMSFSTKPRSCGAVGLRPFQTA